MTSKDKDLLIHDVQVQCKILSKALRIEDTLAVTTANQIKEHAAIVLERAARQLRNDISS